MAEMVDRIGLTEMELILTDKLLPLSFGLVQKLMPYVQDMEKLGENGMEVEEEVFIHLN